MIGRRIVSVSAMLMVAAVMSAFAGAALGDAYKDLVGYDWDQSRAPLSTIESEIRAAATPAQRKAIETKLLGVLADPKATPVCKQFVCRALRRVGSAACVPAMAKLLAEKDLSHMARFVLQYLPGPEATAALIDAAGRVRGPLRIGVITSLGERRDRRAVGALSGLLSGPDVEQTRAAVRALGRIGGTEAAKALAGAKVPKALVAELADARLLCADRILADGDAAAAGAVYEALFAKGNPTAIRLAALRGIVRSKPDTAPKTLLALMRHRELVLRQAAIRFVIEIPGPSVTKAFAAELAGMPPGGQVVLLEALAARGDAAAAPAVTALASSKTETVRLAAIRALAVIGDAGSVPVLAKAAAGGGPAGQAAVDSLNRLRGAGVGEAMSKLLDDPDPAFRAGILGVLAVRADKTMIPAMLKAARDSDRAVRGAAVKGLEVVAARAELPALVSLLLETKDVGELAGLERALSAAAVRVDDRNIRAAPIIAALPRAHAAAKVRLITLLGRLGGAKALPAVRAELSNADADIAIAAVRALHAWPDATAAPHLLEIIKSAKNPVHRGLAFRGYVRMAGLGGTSAGESLRMYRQAMQLAGSATEIKSVLSGLAGARSVDALKLVEPLLAKAELKVEAETAYVQIAGNLRDVAPAEARKALNKVITATGSGAVRRRARAILNEMDKYRGYVTSWLISEPYTKGPLFDTAYPPEAPGAPGVKWKPLRDGVGPQVINLARAVGGGNRAVYMTTHVFSPAARDVRLEIGSDDGVKVWLNGKRVHANNANRPIKIGEDRVDAKLAKGWNRLLVKVTQGGGDWALSVRVTARDGAAIDGLRVSTDRR